jgi:predicted metal-dependent phosphoesterase TrpH
MNEIGKWGRDAGGIVVLAHPTEYDDFTYESVIYASKENLIDGAEVSHPSVRYTYQVDTLLHLCKAFGLKASIGTDYHRGKYELPNFSEYLDYYPEQFKWIYDLAGRRSNE